jgi:hypothetical protein
VLRYRSSQGVKTPLPLVLHVQIFGYVAARSPRIYKRAMPTPPSSGWRTASSCFRPSKPIVSDSGVTTCSTCWSARSERKNLGKPYLRQLQEAQATSFPRSEN